MHLVCDIKLSKPKTKCLCNAYLDESIVEGTHVVWVIVLYRVNNEQSLHESELRLEDGCRFLEFFLCGEFAISLALVPDWAIIEDPINHTFPF